MLRNQQIFSCIQLFYLLMCQIRWICFENSKGGTGSSNHKTSNVVLWLKRVSLFVYKKRDIGFRLGPSWMGKQFQTWPRTILSSLLWQKPWGLVFWRQLEPSIPHPTHFRYPFSLILIESTWLPSGLPSSFQVSSWASLSRVRSYCGLYSTFQKTVSFLSTHLNNVTHVFKLCDGHKTAGTSLVTSYVTVWREIYFA